MAHAAVVAQTDCCHYNVIVEVGVDVGNLELCWDSWDQTTPAVSRHIPIRNYHDPKNHRSNHIVSSATRRDESASPKQVLEGNF